MSIQVSSVDLPTGVTLNYAEQGSPSGIPVVFPHGISDSWRSFELILPRLPDSVRAIALTQRGHGDSSRPESAYWFKDYSDDLTAFLDALKIDKAVVVGHSLGASNGLKFAIDHADRLSGLLLISAFASYTKSEAPHALWEAVSDMPDPVDPGFIREFQESTLGRPIPDAFFQTILSESQKLPAQVWRAVVKCNLEDDDLLQEAYKIRAPTLLVRGEKDELVSQEDAEALKREILNARLLVHEGVGHAVHWEDPDRFAAELKSFLETEVGGF